MTASDMLRMCRDGDFDDGFISFAARALGVPKAEARAAVQVRGLDNGSSGRRAPQFRCGG